MSATVLVEGTPEAEMVAKGEQRRFRAGPALTVLNTAEGPSGRSKH